MGLFSDDISVFQASQQAVVADTASVAQAQATLSADTATLATATAQLGADLNALATDVFVINADGSATIYQPDGHGGFTTAAAVPASTNVPAAAGS